MVNQWVLTIKVKTAFAKVDGYEGTERRNFQLRQRNPHASPLPSVTGFILLARPPVLTSRVVKVITTIRDGKSLLTGSLDTPAFAVNYSLFSYVELA